MNVIISEIQEFQFNKSEHDRSLIKFVDKLEKGVEDLGAIEARHHVANAYTVKLLETKLSREVCQRWFQYEEANRKTQIETSSDLDSLSSTPTKNIDLRFEVMLDFLKKQRRQAERLCCRRWNDQFDLEEAVSDSPHCHTLHSQMQWK